MTTARARRRGAPALVAAAVTTLVLAATPARPCSPAVFDDVFARTAAPPGGLWWLMRVPEAPIGDTVQTGNRAIEVVEAGAGIVVLRVPADAAIGATFALPEGTTLPLSFAGAPELVVVEGAPPADAEIPAPVVALEVMRGIRDHDEAFVLETPGSSCGDGVAVGLLHEAFVGVVHVDAPADLVLDVDLRAAGEDGFVEPTDPRLVDAFSDGTVERIVDRRGRDAAFSLHARFRRAADLAAGPVASSEHVVEPVATTMPSVYIVTCGAAGDTTSAAPAVALLPALARRRRRA